MDNASDYGSEDSRFDSWQDRALFFPVVSEKTKKETPFGSAPVTSSLFKQVPWVVLALWVYMDG